MVFFSKNGIVSVVLVLFSNFVSSENLLNLYEIAVENDPKFRASIHQSKADSEAYSQARAALLPSLDFEYTYDRTSQEIINSENRVYASGSATYGTTNITVSLEQSIYNFTNWANFSQAKEIVKRATADIENAKQDLILRVTTAYFNILKAQDNYKSVKAQVNALQQHFELVEKQLQTGLIHKTDYMDVEARYLQTKAALIERKNDFNEALLILHDITGFIPNTLNTLGDNTALVMPMPNEPDLWVQRAYKINPEIISKQLSVEIARQEIRKQMGGHYPTLDLALSKNRNKTDGSLFGGGSEVDEETVEVTFSLPIYSGGAVSSRVNQNEFLFYKANDELELAYRNIARQTHTSFVGLSNVISKIEALKKSMQSYEEIMKVKEAALNAGMVAHIEVLDAVQDLYMAKVNYLAARYDYLINILNLKRAAGMLSKKDIEDINFHLSDDEITTDLHLLSNKDVYDGVLGLDKQQQTKESK